MMEAVSTSETSVNFYQTTRLNIPGGSNIHTHRHENLMSDTECPILGMDIRGFMINSLYCISYAVFLRSVIYYNMVNGMGLSVKQLFVPYQVASEVSG
jgi:hypothetical protein